MPTASDVACIPAGASVQVRGGSETVGWLEGEGSVTVMYDGALDIADTEVPSIVGSLTLQNATLTGGGEIDVTGSLTVDEARLSGTGRTVLESGGIGTIESWHASTLASRTLVNLGTITWTAGAIVAESGAHIENAGTFYANDDCSSGCGWQGLQPGTGTAGFENTATGKVLKEAGSVTYIDIPFDNQGSVQTNAGTIQLDSGGIPNQTAVGSWSANGTGSLIEFNGGSFNFAAGVTLEGDIALTSGSITASALKAKAAAIAIENASLLLTGAASSIESLTLGKGPYGTSANSTLGGTGEVDIGVALELDEGTIAGSGSVVIGEIASARVDSYTAISLDGRELVNYGRVNWSAGAIVVEGGGESDNAATFVANDDGPHCSLGCNGSGILSGSGGGTFENASTGSVLKEAGSLTAIDIPFDNQGSVQSTAGEMQLDNGGIPTRAATGSWRTAGTDSLIEFNGGEFDLSADAAMSGAIAITHGIVTASALHAQYASIAIDGGTLILNGTTPSQIESLSMGHGPNGWTNYSFLEGSDNIQVTHSFAWEEGVISGGGSLALEPSSTGTLGYYDRLILVGKKLINYGTLSWDAGTIAGANGAELLNENLFAANDTRGAECGGACGMQTVSLLYPLYGENVFSNSFEGTPQIEGALSGGATFVNEGTVNDPEATCPPPVQIGWSTSGQGAFNDLCTHYSERVRSAPPEIKGEAEEGQTLTSTTGVWESIPYPTFTYQWERCDGEQAVDEGEVLGGDCVDIEGATGDEYTPTSADVGYTLRIAVTAHKRLGTQTVLSGPTLPIAPPWEEEPGEEETEEGEVLTSELEEEGEEEATQNQFLLQQTQSSGLPNDRYRNTITGNVEVKAFTVTGEPRPPFSVWVQGQISLNGRQARVTFTTKPPSQVKYVGLTWEVKWTKEIGSGNKLRKNARFPEPLDTTNFNIYLPSPGVSEIELKPEYAGPNAVKPGVAKLAYQPIWCRSGSECEFL